MEKVDCCVIGCGVVGLAVAEALSRKFGEIVAFERHEQFGQETSSRNSEVIHAGIYYPQASLKSRLCLRGNQLLYPFCCDHGIAHRKCGKVIISTTDQEARQIDSIHDHAVSVGVPELKKLTRHEVNELEPEIFSLNGLYSGSTGIIDSHGLMEALFDQAKERGVLFAFGAGVSRIEKSGQGYLIEYGRGEKLAAERVVNCAGLSADEVARAAGFDIAQCGYRLHYCKGDYFSVSAARNKLRHLVYPVPHEKGYGLGVHATLDLDGYIRLGPDATYVEKISYEVDPAKRHDFYAAARTYLPWLIEGMLAPDTAGMRPKLQGPEDGFRDFVINHEAKRGFPNFINLIGIESPGLTASLAIGEYVAGLL